MAIGAYPKTTWANSPSTTSPISAANFQHIEDQVKDITDAVLTKTTWTPTLIGSSTAGTQTYAGGGQVGYYVKIGPIVYIWGYVSITAKDAGIAGNIHIGGLPYTVDSNVGAGIAPRYYTGFTFASSSYTQLTLTAVSGTTVIAVYNCGSAQTAAAIAVSGLAAASTIAFSGMYLTTS